jgi:tetratricopeptide (TPR) repeat protein
LISTGNYSDAIYYFKYLLSKKGNYSKYYLGLADAYYRSGNKELALRNFKAAVNLNATNKHAIDMIKKIENE